MKKLAIVAILSVVSFAGFAQDKDNGGKKIRFSVGADVNLPMGDMGDTWGIGFGGSAMAEYMMKSNLSLTLSAGYNTYGGKDITVLGQTTAFPNLNVIPVMAGVRYYVNPKIYTTGQIGMSFWNLKDVDDSNESDFTWALGAGYYITPNIDLGVKFNSIGTEGSASNAIAFRLAYNF